MRPAGPADAFLGIACVFDAATFAFGGALGGRISLGVSQASFDQYARDIMAWLGIVAAR